MKNKNRTKTKTTQKVEVMPILRDSHGRLQKGTRGISKGRPAGSSFMDEFKLAIKTVEKTKRRTLLERFVLRAYQDDRVLIACIDRLLPALKAIQIEAGIQDSMTDEFAESVKAKLAERFSLASKDT